MRNLLTTIVLGILPLIVFSQDKVSDYISNYKHIAISEMNRSGIPASITLAQGMFESAYGLSPSAIGYNNHFGIKCKKEWTGSYFYKHDDDRDKNGKLIPSCFRAYSSVQESFEDHTDFLVERERYAELFTYAQSDYYNWAMGLERCGYATNKMYAERLVEIIERYALHQFDKPEHLQQIFVSSDNQDTPVATDAFSDITSASTSVDDISKAAGTMKAEQKLKEVTTEEHATLKVLNSFEEFTSVSIIPQPESKPSAKKGINETVKSESISRINQAIILPANYRRQAVVDQSATKMDRR